MSPSILEKMGCSNSKEASTKKKKNEPLLLCKERKRFVKQAIDSRCALAAAHVSYVRSLRNIGACLRQYAEAETVAAVASSPSHNSSSYPDDDDDGDSVDSPLSHNTKPKPVLSLSYTKSANSTVTYTMNPLDMSELSPPPPPPPLRPRRPETSSWDYFDTCDEFDSFRLTDNASLIGLEKQSKQSNAEDFKTEQRKQSSEDEGEREDPSEFITHRAKDFVSSMKDIEHKFFRASESGKEVSRMLEANKIRVGFADTTTGKGNSVAFLSALKRACCRGKKSHSPVFKEPLHQQVTKVIVWKRTSSSRSSTSRNPLIEEDHDDNESGSDFTQEFCMISGSHSSSLDRLYAWERKLYDEVKASEMIRKEYDKKCEQLRNQFTKDHSAKAMDKTRAAAKDLHSRIRVAIQSVDSISKRIERIRDEELQPQLLEFLQGLIRMWKAMLECHHSQYITISLAYHCRNTSKTGPENALKRRIWSELLEETECFGLSFADLVNSMTSYVEALNGWLHNCVLLPQERSTRNRRPWSPRRVLAPPIFVLCRDWSAGMKSLPSDELSRSIKEFSTDMEMLGEEKEDSVLVSEDLSSVHSSLAKLLERLKKFSEASLKMYEDVKVKSEEAVVAYTNHSNCGRPLL
ncbi:protein ROLLING AND ERECT LEAF 2 [Brassica rapa]|uniref:protein ROLLING AND ERECT LEAF 2 n=1 Tax=Brassica campestris TaxID=3711 RepID=UPI0004F178AE|nr:protein ROLLING AND ERECT LEAF 2 [Brassica rapa]XP_013661283.2 protein ROLLING AND ERECT LEAF 2 [Brassica napus]